MGKLEVDHVNIDEGILPPILGLNVIVEFHLCYTQPVKSEGDNADELNGRLKSTVAGINRRAWK